MIPIPTARTIGRALASQFGENYLAQGDDLADVGHHFLSFSLGAPLTEPDPSSSQPCRNPRSAMSLNSSSSDDNFYAAIAKDRKMRTTVSLDDELLAKAKFYTGINETAAVIRQALRTLVELEASRRLARLGGTEPDLRPIPRRRSSRK
jgi:Arc/MetJ family transcription regulator